LTASDATIAFGTPSQIAARGDECVTLHCFWSARNRS
jgi:hypothetical protein